MESQSVASAYKSYSDAERTSLLALRELIFAAAESIDGVGPLEETLKWGQPSYLTSETGSGSTIRVAPIRNSTTYDYGMFFICSTNLVESFKALFGDTFAYEGNRALVFANGEAIPLAELKECIAMALTYHLT
ncbi:MAG: DUF1801 domain-containing protein [Acidimicrobiia bacterium]|nr:DUF1801 domain-containing protein [Acidimicrobiia bacterium]